MESEYTNFLAGKLLRDVATGFDWKGGNKLLFGWQLDIVRWACRRGRAAIWADCGLGKTAMQLEWARAVAQHTHGRVLILTPLAVAEQTMREAVKFGHCSMVHARSQSDATEQICVTNYERIHLFDVASFDGVVLDESSILKHHDGHYRTELIRSCSSVPYRLACTATPAPNDVMELANHAEFLGAMQRTEMLSMWFTHDGGDTAKWRLKGHARSAFWRWVASWAVMLRTPADLGYDATGYDLPELRIHEVVVETDARRSLFGARAAETLDERRVARRDSIGLRCQAAADIMTESHGDWVVWTGLNDESRTMTEMTGGVEVTGSMDDEEKRARLSAFSTGRIPIIVTKPKIGGFGLNWQRCHQVMFVGLGDSYEQYYQAIRRCWRFGQTEPVDVFVVTSDQEEAVVHNIKRKEREAAEMADEMVKAMRETNMEELGSTTRRRDEYERDTTDGDGWTLHLGDCVDIVSEMADESIDYSVFSPPFASLYTYSASDRDMGNSRDYEDFSRHFGFLVEQLFRVVKPGRLVSFHCMLLPTSKQNDGQIGLRDFRGDLIRTFVAAGFIHHSEVVIWKDPVTAMQRTKAIGLLHKQLKKDSTLSRQGIPDYLVTMRKPGVNPCPVTHDNESFPVGDWQRIASPVWMDINPNDTLQKEREDEDERHICPLQLEVIRRALRLWSNPGDLVLSPFAGIGSEGYVALREGRRFVGAELKRSYWEQAKQNMALALGQNKQRTLFG